MAETVDTGQPAFGQPLGKAVFFGGAIRTLRPDRPLLEAVGVAGGRIVCTGSRAEVQSRLTTGDGRRPRPVDLKGLALFPGLVDAHTHLGSYGLRLDWVDLDGVASLEEACGTVARAAAGAAPGKWVRGGGWNKNLWAGGRLPTRADLDRAAPGNPVALSSKDGHALWLNSEALRRAGITRDTPDPPGGEIVRDRSGEPTGILKEKAMDLGYRVVEQPSPEEYAACLERAVRLANAHGLVGVHDMEGRSSFRACQALAAAGRLSLRVWMYLPAEHLGSLEDVGLEGGFGGPYLTVAGVKAFLDGALGSQTADLLRPYEGSQGHGLPTMEAEAFTDLVARAVRAGLPVAVHAIGDRANRKALDAFEANLAATRAARLRHRIEHAQLVHPDDIPRFGRLGVVASMQPIHAPSDRDIAERYWGKRCADAYAWRALADAGVELAFGSDVPVETLDPIQGLYAAVTRKHPLDPERGPWYAEQALTLPEALWAYTGGAARAVGAEREMGTIEVGKRADFTVLSDDVLADGFDPEALLRVRVVATVVGGSVVHGEL